jgi:hypothetical protein
MLAAGGSCTRSADFVRLNYRIVMEVMMTTVLNPADPRVQAILLKAHCKMHRAGMVHSKMPVTRLRVLVANCTGKGPYKAGAWDQMIADLEAVNG